MKTSKNLLCTYGFDSYIQNIDLNKYRINNIARVVSQHKQLYEVVTENKFIKAQVSGRYSFHVDEYGGYPVVGDYVTISNDDDFAIINELLPRMTLFYRKDNWIKEGIQVLVSNFDTILICSSLNRDFNIGRIQRYMILSKESGANVAIILTKSDLCTDVESKIAMCERSFMGIQVHAISSKDNVGMEALNEYFKPKKTVLLIGSSGVGKSSVVNSLCNAEIMKVGDISDDGRGRHTTVHRQIIKLPNDGLLIDTPGLREVGIVHATDSINNIFSDIEQLEMRCKFGNCSHNSENGCAIKEAIKSNELSLERYKLYLVFKMENKFCNDKGQYMLDKWKKSKEKSVNYRKIRKMKGKKH